MNVLLHPTSERILRTFAQDLPGALLLTGPEGIGLTGAVQILAEATNQPEITPDVTMIQPEKDGAIDLEKGTITIEMIRDLYESLRGRSIRRRLIVIRDADRMGIPAQNAFLKLLEEPNDGVHFVLLAHNPQQLLPTIRSRTQHLALRPISEAASNQLLDDLTTDDVTARAQLLFIANGLPALLTRLVKDEALFATRAQIVRDARTLLTATAYQKLVLIEKYKDKREDVLILLQDTAKLIKRSGDRSAIPKISAILDVYDRIVQNGNIRLQLATLAL